MANMNELGYEHRKDDLAELSVLFWIGSWTVALINWWMANQQMRLDEKYTCMLGGLNYI